MAPIYEQTGTILSIVQKHKGDLKKSLVEIKQGFVWIGHNHHGFGDYQSLRNMSEAELEGIIGTLMVLKKDAGPKKSFWSLFGPKQTGLDLDHHTLVYRKKLGVRVGTSQKSFLSLPEFLTKLFSPKSPEATVKHKKRK
jgi:hypothetical protein